MKNMTFTLFALFMATFTAAAQDQYVEGNDTTNYPRFTMTCVTNTGESGYFKFKDENGAFVCDAQNGTLVTLGKPFDVSQNMEFIYKYMKGKMEREYNSADYLLSSIEYENINGNMVAYINYYIPILNKKSNYLLHMNNSL